MYQDNVGFGIWVSINAGDLKSGNIEIDCGLVAEVKHIVSYASSSSSSPDVSWLLVPT